MTEPAPGRRLGAVVLLAGFAVAMALTAGQVVGGTPGLLRELDRRGAGPASGRAGHHGRGSRGLRSAAAAGRRGLVAAARGVDPLQSRVRRQPAPAAVGAGPLAVRPSEGAGTGGRTCGDRRGAGLCRTPSARRVLRPSAVATSWPDTREGEGAGIDPLAVRWTGGTLGPSARVAATIARTADRGSSPRARSRPPGAP